MLADKYAVREYVRECGYGDIILSLYGKWDTADEVLKAWDSLLEEFVLKSNNGCAHVVIVSKNSGGKVAVDLKKLKRDESIKEFSKLSIDYIIYCCDWKTFITHVAYGRSLGEDGHYSRCATVYDNEWNKHPDYLVPTYENRMIPKPQNWEKMLEIAESLSKGHPQTRIDLYNVDGKIYFGEVTMTSSSGFDDEFTEDILLEIGNRITLDLGVPGNEFCNF